MRISGILTPTQRQQRRQRETRKRLRQSRPPLLLIEAGARKQGLTIGTSEFDAYREGWLDRWHGRPVAQRALWHDIYLCGYWDGNRS